MTSSKVNRRDEDGLTPLMGAARKNRPDVVQVLIEAGAELEIEAGAELDARSTAYGTTALVLATDHDFDDVAEILRKAGAADDIVEGQPAG